MIYQPQQLPGLQPIEVARKMQQLSITIIVHSEKMDKAIPLLSSSPRAMGGNPTSWHLDSEAKSQTSYLKHEINLNSRIEVILLPFSFILDWEERLCSLDQADRGKNIPTKLFHLHEERRVPPPSMTKNCTGRRTGRAWQPAATAECFISMPPA